MILGDSKIPPIHTILTVREGRVLLEAVTTFPRLLVNGNRVDTAILEDGDLIVLGNFQFIVHFNHQAIAATLKTPEMGPLQESEFDGSPLAETAGLSAAELVDRLAEEQSQIDRFEKKIETGRQALLQAALDHHQRQDLLVRDAKPTFPQKHRLHSAHQLRGPMIGRNPGTDQQFLQEFERVRRELEDFSLELEHRTEQVSRRESQFDTAAQELVEAQNKLVAQLGTILSQIAARESERAPRAIA